MKAKIHQFPGASRFPGKSDPIPLPSGIFTDQTVSGLWELKEGWREIKGPPYPIRAESILIPEEPEEGRRAETLRYELALGDQRACLSYKEINSPELGAAFAGLSGASKTAIARQADIIFAQGHAPFDRPRILIPKSTGFSWDLKSGHRRFVMPGLLQRFTSKGFFDETGMCFELPSLPAADEICALLEAETADKRGRLALLRGFAYRGLVASLVPIGTLCALVTAKDFAAEDKGTGAGKTMAARWARGALEPIGSDFPPDLRFGELTLSMPGANARLRDVNDTPRMIDDFRYGDHLPASERERCNALIDTLTRTTADGGELTQKARRDSGKRLGTVIKSAIFLTGERFDPLLSAMRRMILMRFCRGEIDWSRLIADWSCWQTTHRGIAANIIVWVLRQCETAESEATLLEEIRRLDEEGTEAIAAELRRRFPSVDQEIRNHVARCYARMLSGLALADRALGDPDELHTRAGWCAVCGLAAAQLEEMQERLPPEMTGEWFDETIRWGLHGRGYLLARSVLRKFPSNAGEPAEDEANSLPGRLDRLDPPPPNILDFGYRHRPEGGFAPAGEVHLGWLDDDGKTMLLRPRELLEHVIKPRARLDRIPNTLTMQELPGKLVARGVAVPDGDRNTQRRRIGKDRIRVLVIANKDAAEHESEKQPIDNQHIVSNGTESAPVNDADNHVENKDIFADFRLFLIIYRDQKTAVPAVPAVLEGQEPQSSAENCGTACKTTAVPVQMLEHDKNAIITDGYYNKKAGTAGKAGIDTVEGEFSGGERRGARAYQINVEAGNRTVETAGTALTAEPPRSATRKAAGAKKPGRPAADASTGKTTSSAAAIDGAPDPAPGPAPPADPSQRVYPKPRERRPHRLASIGIDGLLIEQQPDAGMDTGADAPASAVMRTQNIDARTQNYAALLAGPIERDGVTQLWLPEGVWCDAAGLPAQLTAPEGSKAWEPHKGMPHPFGAGELPPGWRIKGKPGLIYPWAGFEHEDGRETAIVIPGFGLAGGADEIFPRELTAGVCLEALLAWRRATGFVFRITPATMLKIIFDRLHRTPGSIRLDFPDIPADVPAELLRLRPAMRGIIWSRPLTEEEQAGTLHAYDAVAQYLAAMSAVPIGYGAPSHHKQPIFGGAAEKKPGWWHATVTRGEDGQPFWPSWLPDPRFPRRGSQDAAQWYTTGWLAFLAEIGWNVTIDQAWLFPASHRPFEVVYRLLRRALGALNLAAGRPAAEPLKDDPYPSLDGVSREAAKIALDLVKATYSAGTGNMSKTQPYSAQAIVTRARVNLLRRIWHCGQRPFAIRADALYISAAIADPIIAAGNLPLDSQPGHFKIIPEICGLPAGAWLGATASRGPSARELDKLKEIGRAFHAES